MEKSLHHSVSKQESRSHSPYFKQKRMQWRTLVKKQPGGLRSKKEGGSCPKMEAATVPWLDWRTEHSLLMWLKPPPRLLDPVVGEMTNFFLPHWNLLSVPPIWKNLTWNWSHEQVWEREWWVPRMNLDPTAKRHNLVHSLLRSTHFTVPIQQRHRAST